MSGPISFDEGVCAGCGEPLGPPVNWRMLPTGQAYHNDCDPPEPRPEEPFMPKQTLTEVVERKARNAMYGRGQRTLEEDTRD